MLASSFPAFFAVTSNGLLVMTSLRRTTRASLLATRNNPSETVQSKPKRKKRIAEEEIFTEKSSLLPESESDGRSLSGSIDKMHNVPSRVSSRKRKSRGGEMVGNELEDGRNNETKGEELMQSDRNTLVEQLCPSIEEIRASLPVHGPVVKSFNNAYLYYEVVTGVYALQPVEKIIFNLCCAISVIGSAYYFAKFVGLYL